MLCQKLLDERSELLWLSHRGEAQDTTAIPIDEELGEVPLNARSQRARGYVLEVAENGICITPIDTDLLHHGEGDSVVEHAEGGCILTRA